MIQIRVSKVPTVDTITLCIYKGEKLVATGSGHTKKLALQQAVRRARLLRARGEL